MKKTNTESSYPRILAPAALTSAALAAAAGGVRRRSANAVCAYFQPNPGGIEENGPSMFQPNPDGSNG